MDLVFCLVLDILGFRATVIDADAEYQTDAVDRWVGLVDSSASRAGIDRYQLISDSLFAVASPNADGLERVMTLSRRLLDDGVTQGLLVRGAIARGPVRWDDRIAHGSAIVSAYELGESCNWAGVSCTHTFPELRELWSVDSVVQYPVPRKVLKDTLRPALVWRIPEDAELLAAAKLDPTGFQRGLESVLSKLRETALFRDYLKRYRRSGFSDPSTYHSSM